MFILTSVSSDLGLYCLLRPAYANIYGLYCLLRPAYANIYGIHNMNKASLSHKLASYVIETVTYTHHTFSDLHYRKYVKRVSLHIFCNEEQTGVVG